MLWAKGCCPGGVSESRVRELILVFTKDFCTVNSTHLSPKVTPLDPYKMVRLRHRESLCSAGRWPLRLSVSSLWYKRVDKPARLPH